MPSPVSSPDALGVARNLPAGTAPAALDPVVALAQAGLDLQQDPQHRWISLGGELALARVATGLRIERVESNTAVGRLLVDVLGPALADRRQSTVSTSDHWVWRVGSAFKDLVPRRETARRSCPGGPTPTPPGRSGDRHLLTACTS